MNPTVLRARIWKPRIPGPVKLIARRIFSKSPRLSRISASGHRVVRGQQIARKGEDERRYMVRRGLAAQTRQISHRNVQCASGSDIDVAVGTTKLLNEPRLRGTGFHPIRTQRGGLNDNEICRRQNMV